MLRALNLLGSRYFRQPNIISMFSSFNQAPLRTMSKTALILATEGTEDIELTVTSDVLRRANVNVSLNIDCFHFLGYYCRTEEQRHV
jgi:hypothetical protein